MVSILNSLSGRWIETLWSISWQITVLVCIVYIISHFSKKAPPLFHYGLWLIVLIRAAVPFNLPIYIEGYSKTLDYVSVDFPVAAANAGITYSTFSFTAENIFCLIWLAVVLLIGIIILLRAIMLNRSLKVHCLPIERREITELCSTLCTAVGIKRNIPLYYMNMEKEYGPVVSGIFKPRIYLPRWMADTWTARDIEPVLLHELAHIKRYDLVVNWIQIAVQAVYFFHPLVWIANRNIRSYREDICDDFAIGLINAEKKRYGESILRVIEETVQQPIWGMGGIGYIENNNSLTRRIIRIMNKRYELRKKLTFVSGIVLLIVAGIGFFIACEKQNIVDPDKSLTKADDLSFNINLVSNTPINDQPKIISGYDSIQKHIEKEIESRIEEKMGVPPPPPKEEEEIPPFLPLEDQPKIIGGYESIRKNLKYPEIAKKAGIEGTVIIRALIGKDGVPEKIEVVKELGNIGCNEAAIDAVKNVRFEPAKQDGKPVRFWFNIAIRFQLDKNKN